MNTSVFVYGSLKRDFGNHAVLKDSEFIQEDIVMYPGFMVDLGYFPGVVHTGEHLTPIRGEVYSVNDEILANLDRLEGHPDFYCREVRSTKRDLDVWIYVLTERHWSRGDMIEDGLWTRERIAI